MEVQDNFEKEASGCLGSSGVWLCELRQSQGCRLRTRTGNQLTVMDTHTEQISAKAGGQPMTGTVLISPLNVSWETKEMFSWPLDGERFFRKFSKQNNM
jgi:hypothetical protein